MTAVGIKRESAVIEQVIDDKPAVAGLLAPLAYLYMRFRKQTVVFAHQPMHALSHSNCIDDRLDTIAHGWPSSTLANRFISSLLYILSLGIFLV